VAHLQRSAPSQAAAVPPGTCTVLLAPRPHLHQELHHARLRVRAGGVVRPLPGAAAALGHAHHYILPRGQPQQLLLVRQPEAARGAGHLLRCLPLKAELNAEVQVRSRLSRGLVNTHALSQRVLQMSYERGCWQQRASTGAQKSMTTAQRAATIEHRAS